MNTKRGGADSGAVYALGFIGGVVYYIQNAGNFTDGAIGVLKSLAWPAMLVYKFIGL